MVSLLSVSLYGLAAVAGFADALPGLPKRMHERRAGSTSDSNVVGYETETQVVTRTIYKSTSGSVSPTSSGASYYTSTVTINGMQYTIGHGYHNGAFHTLHFSLSFHFWPGFDTYCHREYGDRKLVESHLYLEELYAVVEPQQPAFKLLQICNGVLLPEYCHWQFIACRLNSVRFSKHAYCNEDFTVVKLRCSFGQPEYPVEWQSSVVLLSEESCWQFIASCFNFISFSKHTYGDEDFAAIELRCSLGQPEYPVECQASVFNYCASTQASAQGSTTSSALPTSKEPSPPISSTATSRSSSRTTVTVTASSSPSRSSSSSASSSSTSKAGSSSIPNGSTSSRSRTTVTATASGTSSQVSSAVQPSGSTSSRSRTTVTVTASGTSSKVSTGNQPSVSTGSRSQTTVTASDGKTSSKSPNTSPSSALTSGISKTSVVVTGAGTSSKASSASQPAASSSTKASSGAGQPSSSRGSQPTTSSKTSSAASTSLQTSKVSTSSAPVASTATSSKATSNAPAPTSTSNASTSSQSAAPTTASSKATTNTPASTSTARTSSVSTAPTVISDTATNSQKPSSTSQAPPSSSSAAGMTCTAGDMTYTNGQQYTDSSNVTYTVRCNSDNSQGSYSTVGVSSGGFATCFTACDESSGCAGFTYSGDANHGNCYLKSAEGTYIPAGSSLVSAFRVGGSASGGSPSSSSTGPVSTPNGGSCSALAAQNATYTDENGRTYQVKCGHDYPGPNLATAGVSSYSKCFAACDAVKGCVSFSYLGGSGGGTCYLKAYTTGVPSSGVDGAQLISEPNSSASAFPTQSSAAGTSAAVETGTQSVSSSAATSTATAGSASCQQLGDEYTDASNRTYTVQCGFDHQGGDLKAVSSNSFQGCFPQCDATAGCVGFAYVGGSGPGTCYLKNHITTENANSNVDFAFTNTTSSPTSSQASGTPTGSASSTVTGSESRDAPSATGSSCASYTSPFTDANNQTYIVECGTDHVGGDLTSVSSPSFGDCFSFCDKTTGCVGFAYVGGSGAGTCYLKSSIVPANSNPNVDFAYLPSAAPVSTSSSLASTSASVSSDGSSTTSASQTASSGAVTTSVPSSSSGSSSPPSQTTSSSSSLVSSSVSSDGPSSFATSQTTSGKATTSTITSPPKATSFSRSVVITTEGKTVTVYDDPADSEVVVATSGFQGIDIPYGSTTLLFGLQHIALPSGRGIEVGGTKYPFDAPASSTASAPATNTTQAILGLLSIKFACNKCELNGIQNFLVAVVLEAKSTVTSPSSSQSSSKSMATVVGSKTSSSIGSQSKSSNTGGSSTSQSKASGSSSQTSSTKPTTSTSITTVTSPSRTTSQSTSSKPTTSSRGTSATPVTSSSRTTSTSSSQVGVTSSKVSSSSRVSLSTRTTETSTLPQSSTLKSSRSSAPLSSTRTSTASTSQAPATSKKETSSTSKPVSKPASTQTTTTTTSAQLTTSKLSSSSAPLSSSMRTSTSPAPAPSSSSKQSGGTVTSSTSSATSSVQPSPTKSCPELDKNYPFFLQSNVTSGNRAFHGLYVRKPPFNPAGSIPTLGNSWRDAAQVYYDVYKHLIAAKDDSNCNLYPFHLSPDDKNGPYGECTFADDRRQGPKARKNDRDGKVTYDDEFFGSWLACQNRQGVPELKFWQRVGVDEFDAVKCAKLELIAQNI
ncbi:hypothetical protein KC361_g6163 [Hortaea werneckii]|nr:hypothetical protein KC361_g6163 [Hortaea werneckii]